MTVSLATLDLTSEQHDAALDSVRRLAYEKWLDAGQPAGTDLECWLAAEREWIEHFYVPNRTPGVASMPAENAS